MIRAPWHKTGVWYNEHRGYWTVDAGRTSWGGEEFLLFRCEFLTEEDARSRQHEAMEGLKEACEAKGMYFKDWQ